MENDSYRHYARYHAEQFAADEAFVRWVLSPDPESNAYWMQWLQAHPEKEGIIVEAQRLVNVVRLKPELPDEETKAQIWENIKAQRSEIAAKRPTVIRWRNWQIAASVVLVVALGLFTRYWLLKQTEIVTAFGEIRLVELPDGSLVTLNGNSTLRYDRRWNEQEAREVWLEGEAYFTVQKKYDPVARDVKFTVHAGNLDVEVLGTQFNVNNRRGKTRVVLDEGKVRLTCLTGDTAHKVIQLKPGEVAELTEQADMAHQKAVHPEAYTSWKQKQLIFHNEPLADIAAKLEDEYGYRITFENPEIGRKRFTASLKSENVENLFIMFAQSFDLTVSREGKTVTFREKDTQ